MKMKFESTFISGRNFSRDILGSVTYLHFSNAHKKVLAPFGVMNECMET